MLDIRNSEAYGFEPPVEEWHLWRNEAGAACLLVKRQTMSLGGVQKLYCWIWTYFLAKQRCCRVYCTPCTEFRLVILQLKYSEILAFSVKQRGQNVLILLFTFVCNVRFLSGQGVFKKSHNIAAFWIAWPCSLQSSLGLQNFSESMKRCDLARRAHVDRCRCLDKSATFAFANAKDTASWFLLGHHKILPIYQCHSLTGFDLPWKIEKAPQCSSVYASPNTNNVSLKPRIAM